MSSHTKADYYKYIISNPIVIIIHFVPINNKYNNNISINTRYCSEKTTAEDVPKLGIKVFDEISLYMKDNMPPSNESSLLQKFATIGVGPGKIPSVEVKNTTILNALNTSIPEGEKLITARTINTAESPNGWKYDMKVGDFGTDYYVRLSQKSKLEQMWSKKHCTLLHPLIPNPIL